MTRVTGVPPRAAIRAIGMEAARACAVEAGRGDARVAAALQRALGFMGTSRRGYVRALAVEAGLPLNLFEARMKCLRDRLARRSALAEGVSEARCVRSPKQPPRLRPCLCCRRPFDSAGPGNRLCGACRAGEAVETYRVIR